jgi:hypothetical protein
MEHRELSRMLNVQGQIESWQDEQRFRGRSAFNGNPIINTTSPIAATHNLSAATGSSSNGVASSSRSSHTPVAASTVSTQHRQLVPTRISNGNGNGHAGRSIDDAIAIDDDDDDTTVSVATPAVPPTPAITNAVPPTTSTHRAAPPPPFPAPSQTNIVPPDPSCPMCNKHCGLDIKSCAEKRGGRKALKDRIRKLSVNTTPSETQREVITALYEVYQVVSSFPYMREGWGADDVVA